MKNDDNQNRDGNELHIDVGTVSAAGHVVIAGGNATVQGSTRGDGNETHTITVGGIETTEAEFATLKASLDKLEKTVETAPLEPDERYAAQHNVTTLKQQLTSPNKPNDHILIQATEALFKFGPDIAGAVISAFTTPLVGKIVSFAGERALTFYRDIRNKKIGNVDDEGKMAAG